MYHRYVSKFKPTKESIMQAILETAKIFTTGRSQAVRLPKAFRFNTLEVTIERQGDSVILRPKLSREAWWQQLQTLSTQSTSDFPLIERERGNLSDPVSFDD
jgi:antitoxin VapB